MKRQQMRVVGHEEDAIAENGHASIGSFRRIAARLAGTRAFVVPDGASCARIQSEHLIRTGDVHHAIDHNRCDLEHLMIDREDPFELQAADVRWVDLVQRAVAIAADVAVIRRPVAGLGLAICLERRAAFVFERLSLAGPLAGPVNELRYASKSRHSSAEHRAAGIMDPGSIVISEISVCVEQVEFSLEILELYVVAAAVSRKATHGSACLSALLSLARSRL